MQDIEVILGHYPNGEPTLQIKVDGEFIIPSEYVIEREYAGSEKAFMLGAIAVYKEIHRKWIKSLRPT